MRSTLAAAPAVASALVRRVADLSSELAEIAQQLDPGIDSWTSPASAALLRLAAGCGEASDPQTLGMTVVGARVVILRVSSTEAASRWEGRLTDTRSYVVSRRADDELLVLMRGLPRSSGEDRSRHGAEVLARLVLREDLRAAVGISSPLRGVTDLPAGAGEAADAAALARRTEDRWLVADEHWATLSMARLARSTVGMLTLDNPFTRLRDYDDRNDTDLVGSVAAWLAHNCETRVAAAALTLHPNSLRYRLRRAEQVAGLDLTNPEVRLLAHLVLRP